MRFHKPLKVPLLTRVLGVGRRNVFHVAAMFGFPLGNPRALMDEVSFWAAITPLLGASGVLDEGVTRARAELLVAGSFHAPNDAPTPASYVRVSLGAVEKRLSVLGDRHWHRGVPTQPVPMTSMPLDWSRAFGGPKHGPNPYGMGIELVERDGAQVQPLPNVEPWGALLRSPSERPAPAGLGAMDVTFEQRRKRAGTYGKDYVAEKRVGLPDDYDPTLWNVASPDQWAPSLWRGDEAFTLENLHPKESTFHGKLPGLVPRVFLVRGGAFTALPMQCDVVWLFPDADLGVVIFHGNAPVTEADGADVEELLAGADVAGAERPEEHFHAAWRRRKDPDRGKVALLSDSDLMPPRDSGVAPNIALPDIGQWTKSQGYLAKNMHRGAVARHEESVRRWEAEGVDVAAMGLGPPPAPPVFPDPEDLDALAEEMERVAERDASERAAVEGHQAAAEAKSRAAYAEQGLDYDAIAAERKASTEGLGGPPRFSAAQVLGLQDEMLAQAGDGSPASPGYAPSGATPLARLRSDDQRAFLEEQEARAQASYRASAQLQPPAPPMTAEASGLARALVATARDVGEPLTERDFTGADFRGLDLRGMDLSRSFLECADLRDADLSDAVLEGAVLARADLRGAKLSRAKLRGANLGLAVLSGAHLDSADLREAVLMRTELEGASLAGADLEGADVLEVKWQGADLSRARLVKVTFLKGELTGCRFTEGALEQVLFVECKLDGCDFSGADLRRASFIKSSGAKVCFAGARLFEAVMVGEGQFVGADLRGALLERACLRTCAFRDARFDGATAPMVDLSQCDATGARFDRADLRSALLHRTNLEGASLRGCNLLEALLLDAKLSRADFTGAQLTRAVLTGARGDGETRFTDAVVAHARFDRSPEKGEGA